MDQGGRSRGALILVCGPSGAGKDAIIESVRRRLADDPRIVFPLRTISRSGEGGGELHVAVTPAQFDRLRRSGAFALCWGGGGLNYAIPATIDAELAAGRTVVANVSSRVLAEARRRYPNLLVVWVAASEEARRRRLLQRGRETPAEIERRLCFADEPPTEGEFECLDNEGPLEASVTVFLTLLAERRHGKPARARVGLSSAQPWSGM